MINPNNIIANYQISRIHKNTGMQVLFLGNAIEPAIRETDSELEINGKIIPKENIKFWNHCNEYELISPKNIMLKTPLPVKKGLIKLSELTKDLENNNYTVISSLKENLSLVKDFAGSVHKIDYLKNRDMHKLLNTGSASIAIDIGVNPDTKEKEVLKFSTSPNFPESLGRRFEPSFDLPIFEQGNIDGFYYYIQPEANTDEITSEHVKEITKEIENKGYESFDLGSSPVEMAKEQVMMYKGRPYLIDPECARLPFAVRFRK